MKRFSMLVLALLVMLLVTPGWVFAEVSLGEVSASSPDVDIEIFGSLAVQPKFVDNANFGEEGGEDYLSYTNGVYADHVVRQQARLGFKGGTDNFSFLTILESEFNMDADNADRENAAGAESGAGAASSGSDFGIERLHFEYDMNSNGIPASMFTGWDMHFLDRKGGGAFLFGDDVPYIGFKGDLAQDTTWDVRYFIRDDNISGVRGTDVKGHDGDWRWFSANVEFPVGPMMLKPTYVYSVVDHTNSTEDAFTHYMGFSAWGELGRFTPRAEFFYVHGDFENYDRAPQEKDADIRSMAAFAGAEMSVSPAVNPYFGGYWLQGDDDANDDEINAFNGLSNAGAIAGMFGMPNGLLNHGWSGYGKAPFTNQPETLGGGKPYGTVGLSGSSMIVIIEN